MELCPPELHSYIFQLASDDTGSTIRSLSIVSSYFLQIAKEFLYQSVVVTKTKQIHDLTARLNLIPVHLRTVRHLCITDLDGSDAKPVTKELKDAMQVTDDIHRLLTLVSPSLETLVLSPNLQGAASPILFGRLFRIHFPNLRELSISGFYPFPSTPNTFPSLTHLHLHGNRNPHGLISTGGLAIACPNLTHLRVSGLSLSVSFIGEIETLVSDSNVQKQPLDAVPIMLRQINLQLDTPPPSGASPRMSLAQQKDAALVEKLGRIVGRQGDAIRVVVHERGSLDGHDFYRFWRDAFAGVSGCWDSWPCSLSVEKR